MMIDLKAVVEKYPECLDNAERLKAYLLDLYPTENARCSVISNIFICGIADEIKKANRISRFDVANYCQRVKNRYGYSADIAKECIEIWCDVFGKRELSFNNSEIEGIVSFLDADRKKMLPTNRILRLWICDIQKFFQVSNRYLEEIEKIRLIADGDSDYYKKALIEVAAISKARAVGALEHFGTAMHNPQTDISYRGTIYAIDRSSQYKKVVEWRNNNNYLTLLKYLNFHDETLNRILEENYVRGLLIEEEVIFLLDRITKEDSLENFSRIIDVRQALQDILNSITIGTDDLIEVKESWLNEEL